MGCCCCCRSFVLAALTLVSCGLFAAGCIILVISEKKNQFDEMSKVVWTVSIVICVFACILFIFTIYASCCGGILARRVLGVIFIIFALLIAAAGICFYTLKSQMIQWIEDHYVGSDLFAVIPNVVDCCEGPNGWFECPYPFQSCKSALEDLFSKYGLTVMIISLVLALLFFNGAGVAFCSQ